MLRRPFAHTRARIAASQESQSSPRHQQGWEAREKCRTVGWRAEWKHRWSEVPVFINGPALAAMWNYWSLGQPNGLICLSRPANPDRARSPDAGMQRSAGPRWPRHLAVASRFDSAWQPKLDHLPAFVSLFRHLARCCKKSRWDSLREGWLGKSDYTRTQPCVENRQPALRPHIFLETVCRQIQRQHKVRVIITENYAQCGYRHPHQAPESFDLGPAGDWLHSGVHSRNSLQTKLRELTPASPHQARRHAN